MGLKDPEDDEEEEALAHCGFRLLQPKFGEMRNSDSPRLQQRHSQAK